MVLDPVLVCKETHDVAVSELCQELIRFFPYVTVITPNLPEAELLAGQKIETLEDMKSAAQKLHDLGAPAVIIRVEIVSVRIRLWMSFMTERILPFLKIQS